MGSVKVGVLRIPEEIQGYVVAAVLCLLILAYVMQLWDADLNIPFSYGLDALLTGSLVKGIIDNGWYLHNSFLGMPAGQDMRDFPMTDTLNFVIMKVISLFARNYAVTMNLYFLLTFPMTTLTTLFVFRKLGLSRFSSIVGSLLFTFMPYHFLRGEGHLGLSAYYLIPLTVLVILWVHKSRSLLFSAADAAGQRASGLLNYRSLMSLAICILVASSFIYYSFFSCFFLIVAGISSSVSQKNKYPLLNSAILVSVITLGLVANMLPSIIYHQQHGTNADVGTRNPWEAEYFGLKITQLLMPVSDHRLQFMAYLSENYNSTAVLVNENYMSSLGLVGSSGFLLLIAWIFYRALGGSSQLAGGMTGELNMLGVLNLSAVLLATIGGFSSVFSYVISSQIRSYNRVSIYIAFFSLLALFMILESLLKGRGIKAGHLYTRLFLFILVVGLVDQTTEYFTPPYSLTRARYLTDESFISKIEAAMPPNALVFQLPYVPFPEFPKYHNMSGYEHLKAYLHSTGLRWSYGAMRGREADEWQKTVSEKPAGEMVKNLSSVGFKGIYVDTYGYPDTGVAILAELRNATGFIPIVSANNRLYFFDISGRPKT